MAAGEGSVVETVAGQASEEGVGEGGGVGESMPLCLRDSRGRRRLRKLFSFKQ